MSQLEFIMSFSAPLPREMPATLERWFKKGVTETEEKQKMTREGGGGHQTSSNSPCVYCFTCSSDANGIGERHREADACVLKETNCWDFGDTTVCRRVKKGVGR